MSKIESIAKYFSLVEPQTAHTVTNILQADLKKAEMEIVIEEEVPINTTNRVIAPLDHLMRPSSVRITETGRSIRIVQPTKASLKLEPR